MGAATRLNSLRISLTVSGISPGSGLSSTPFFQGVSGDEEEGSGGHGQGDVPIPCLVSADLVVVEPGFVFGGLGNIPRWPIGHRRRGPTRSARCRLVRSRGSRQFR